MKTLEEVKQEMLSRAMNRPLSKYSLKDSDGRIAVSSNSPGQHAFIDAKDEAFAQSHYTLSEKFKREDGTIIKYWKLEPSPKGYFQSADGDYYLSTELPELDDDFVKQQYEQEQELAWQQQEQQKEVHVEAERAAANAMILDLTGLERTNDHVTQQQDSLSRLRFSEDDNTVEPESEREDVYEE